MALGNSTIEEVKAQLDIVDVISYYLLKSYENPENLRNNKI